MGIAIYTKGADRETVLLLTCDDHGLLEAMPQEIPGDGFIAKHASAMALGWKESFGAQGHRIWLCPECSGKVPR